uniref:Uncharacterized protein n=1 Tax=Anguilla anguilla TaxID=7936 RepID=A0A0E9P538_ANGAN
MRNLKVVKRLQHIDVYSL